ncbi:uncharacterized protein LOC111879955 [Lactuca sativa]|uniref:uncharacterized protein LOC111879955 n=1 Tax=Lactuca sativa TaxID=4236 RepID=UPI000CD81953|nr:uncharacterized protein LOC111879955 [Lactuca sativa]
MSSFEISQNSSNSIDISNPYHLGSSDNSSSVLVSNVFSSVGFSVWKQSMIIALSAKNMLGIVDGSISQPFSTSSTYANWYRVNFMVTKLTQRFEQSDGALIYQFQQQLYSLSQGSDDFSTYFTKLTKIWDELRIVQGIPECICAASAGILKYLDDQRLIQLLMGLNDSYNVLRGQILMMKPLPSFSTVYSMIIQEERQRDINMSSAVSVDAIVMNVLTNHSSNSSKKSLVCAHCKKNGHSKSQSIA